MADMELLFTTQKFDGRVVGILKSFLAMSLETDMFMNEKGI
jgi:hypothetical protein